MPARRPPKGTTERTAQQRYRAKEIDAGITQVNIRVPVKFSAKIKAFASVLLADNKPSLAFEKAFPTGVKAILKRHTKQLPDSRD